jgi:hypothetical protein
MASIDIVLSRGDQQNQYQIHHFEGSWQMITKDKVTEGKIRGEALYSQGLWFLRGHNTLNEDNHLLSVIGGFAANIEIGTEGPSDDAITWNVDGFVREK